MAELPETPPLVIETHPDVRLRIAGYVREDELPERLAEQTSYAVRLRRELRDTGEELAAVKAERDGLRLRVRQLEYNVATVIDNDREKSVEVEVRRRVERFMQERPRRRG